MRRIVSIYTFHMCLLYIELYKIKSVKFSGKNTTFYSRNKICKRRLRKCVQKLTKLNKRKITFLSWCNLDGRWLLGITVCQLFTTADILLCTSSILNLCAIALDRYFAIHDPINYAQKRTPRFVCLIILIVWILSGLISIPPLAGWNDWLVFFTQNPAFVGRHKSFKIIVNWQQKRRLLYFRRPDRFFYHSLLC